MFFVLKKRWIILSICLILGVLVLGVCFFSYKSVYIPKGEYSIVIDAGHGGIDGGCVGKTTGVYESDLNLKYAKTLGEILKKMDIKVFYTRENEEGLYDKNAKNLKRDDMKKRREIIEKYSPNLVVSIHMNSFPLSSSIGAQAFYKKGNEGGKNLATSVQEEIFALLSNTKRSADIGDYYILNCSEIPSVLVECGFLSNANEERLLIDNNYIEKFCYALSCGIFKYLNAK